MNRPLAVLGPTASGKSALAHAVAQMVEGTELVTADSMQVYRGMNIGTATPTTAERAEVVHHLLDVADPSEEYSVGAYRQHVLDVLADIERRDARAVLVGGTGLYVRAVVDDLDVPPRFPEVVTDIETRDTDSLHARLTELDARAAERIEPNNRRRIVRALEVTIGSGRPFSSYGPGLDQYPPTRFVQVAIRWPREVLDRRIVERYERQLDEGFLDEVRALSSASLSRTAAKALGYSELLAHLRGECSLDEAIADAVTRTRRFARRQERWFRRDPRITWFDGPVSEAEVVEHWQRVSETGSSTDPV